MATESVKAIIEGGKASAAPPLGPALGPMGVNIANVIADINKKTVAFKGMQVPITVVIDKDTKTYEIEVGTPSTATLIKKEANLDKASGKAKVDFVADLLIEQVIKIAKMKEDSISGKTMKDKVTEVCGTCTAMGILVEGKRANETIADIKSGKFDAKIKAEKTELSAEELKKLEAEKKKLAEETTRRHAEEEKRARDIVTAMAGKEKSSIKTKLHEAKISEELIVKLLAEIAGTKGEAAAAAGKAPAKAAAPAKKK